MYQHKPIHKAIQGAISKAPRIVIVDVTVDPEWTICGEPCIIFQNRGCAYKRPYTAEDIRETLAIHGTHEGFVGEGKTYRHLYFCSDDVPADIRNSLAGFGSDLTMTEQAKD